MPREVLTRTLEELAGKLVEDFDVIDLLTLLTERCVEALELSAAGILLATSDGDLQAVASSSHALAVVESFELQADEHPCLDCYRTGEPIINVGLSGDERPRSRLVSLALECGFRSVHAFPMHLRDFMIGALGLFRSDDKQLDQADAHVAQIFANVSTTAIFHHQATLQGQVLKESLQYALDSRITIGQAKGVVAESLGLDLEQGFIRLRQFAHDHNVRLVEVAHDVIEGNLLSGALGQP